ncbi:MAG TPA: hypothetical protein PK756_08535, partial [Piscinibacter sp.]|nr:hypothetical protein [Piscinibacter sp.]
MLEQWLASAGHQRDWRPVDRMADDAVARASKAVAFDFVDQLRRQPKAEFGDLGAQGRDVGPV